MNNIRLQSTRIARKAIVLAVSAACAGSALAFEIETESGWTGALSSKVSIGGNWRAEAPDKALIGVQAATLVGDTANASQYAAIAGAQSGFAGDIGSLNYAKGDMYSATAKLLTELSLSKGDIAFLIRAKAWYDYAAKNNSVPYGNRAAWLDAGNGRGPAAKAKWDKPLSDTGAPALSRFDGIELMDAYVSSNFDLGSMPAQVRLGRQVTNWGEGIFSRGISQLAPLDLTAMRRAGSELKEILLPTLSLTGNVGLPGGMSVEGVYQIKWEQSVAENCGSLWNRGMGTIGATPGACDRFLPIALVPNAANISQTLSGLSNPAVPTGNTSYGVPQAKGITPDDAGAWGLAFRFPVEAIDTEFALYAMNIASTLPTLSAKAQVTTLGGKKLLSLLGVAKGTGVSAGPVPASVALDYLDGIKIFGLSAATNMAGISFGAEISHQQNVPVTYNLKDVEGALGNPVSPVVAKVSGLYATTPDGTLVNFNAYERFDKTQLIVNGVASLGDFAKMIDATTALLIAEVSAEWNNVPDYRTPGALRFGRGGGQANFYNAAGTLLNPNIPGSAAGADRCVGATGFAVQTCQNDGFVTDSAWGYRIRGAVTYSQIFGSSWSASPSVFFAHDVSGVSMDAQYQEGRKTLALGLEFDLNKLHTVNIGYTRYSGDWNVTRDNDNYSMSYSYAF